jgi:carbonic anhydrase
MVIAHTGCRMTTDSENDVHAAIHAAGGPDTRSLRFLTTGDQRASVAADVQRIRSWPFLGTLTVGGFVYDIDSGQLAQVC